MKRNDVYPERILRLPKWAQNYISELERKVKIEESNLTKPEGKQKEKGFGNFIKENQVK